MEEPTLKLGDDTTVIVLNTKGTLDDVDESFIYEVIRLIEEYSNKYDEEIAEMLVD